MNTSRRRTSIVVVVNIGTQAVVDGASASAIHHGTTRNGQQHAAGLPLLQLTACELCQFALQLRVHISAPVLALHVGSHLLEASFDPLLEWLHGLIDSRTVDDQSGLYEWDLKCEQFLELRDELHIFRMI